MQGLGGEHQYSPAEIAAWWGGQTGQPEQLNNVSNRWSTTKRFSLSSLGLRKKAVNQNADDIVEGRNRYGLLEVGYAEDDGEEPTPTMKVMMESDVQTKRQAKRQRRRDARNRKQLLKKGK